VTGFKKGSGRTNVLVTKGMHSVGRAAEGGKLKKNTHTFLDAIISKRLHDLSFRGDQPLKSADDYYIRTLRNRIGT
jgi:hypothetical protein